MKDIKIFVTHSPNKSTAPVHAPLFYNIIAGSEFQTSPCPENFLLDNTGDNISCRNQAYCELTTQYWVWKNQQADYFGFCHYRRLFNFNKQLSDRSSAETIEYSYLNDKIQAELGMDSENIRAYAENFDFLIAKGVKTTVMGARTVYEQYDKAPSLHIKDIDLLLEIIDEKYPDFSQTARVFFKGNVFYPYNMFIMRKELFQEYSAFLFGLLEEFEHRADMQAYSRESYRTIGHLGERIAGIFFLHIKKQKKYRLGELQVAVIRHTEQENTVSAVPGENVVPIVLAANQKYVPVLYTCAQSIVNHCSPEYCYEIYIFHTDIAAESQKDFDTGLTRQNVRFHFINVGRYVAGYRLQAKQHITTETFFRFLILDILKSYPKVVYLDCDLIVCRDIADLYAISLKEHLIAAVLDSDFSGQCNMKNAEMLQYCRETLGMEDPFSYFQAGVLVFNVQELRKTISVEQLFRMADMGDYRFSDQDILNIICKDKVLYLDMSWNMLCDCDHFRWHEVIRFAPRHILDAYEEARKHPYIIHYAGYIKPWQNPNEDFASEFWLVARQTKYYEILLWNMWHTRLEDLGISVAAKPKRENNLLEFTRRIARHFFPKEGKARRWAINIYFKLKNIRN